MSLAGKIFLGALGAAVLGLWYWVWGIEFLRNLWIGTLPILPAVLVIVGAVGAFIFAYFLDGGLRALAVIAGVALVGWFIWLCAVMGYDTAHNYAVSVEVTETATPEFAERAAYEGAQASQNANLQNTAGEATSIKILAGEGENGEWNTLVNRRGWQVGYESIQVLDIPLYGQITPGNVAFCDFNENAALHFGGALPHNNLGRMILMNLPPNATYDQEDTYGYCDGDVPMVVAPLKYLDGFYAATWKYYGIAVYNGETGDFQIITDEKEILRYPGPVYPLSLARDTLNAYQAGGDYWSYVQNRFGYERPYGNAEISLRYAGTDKVAFVSPLTPRGSSESIVALAVVPNREVTVNGRNTVTIHTFSNSNVRDPFDTVDQTIRSNYSYLTDWASGMEVFEIVPRTGTTWVASIGKAQSINYRAYITADGTITMFDRNGREVGKVEENGTVTIPDSVDDLTALTTAELRELADRVLDELASRIVED